jgi:hypothetical protein
MRIPNLCKDIIMSVIPEGEQLRKAIKWISEERSGNPESVLAKLIDDACMKFDSEKSE